MSGKRVALLCPGLSLNVRWPDAIEADFDLIVAVNTAAWRFTCDWLVFSDRHIIAPMHEGAKHWPRVGVVTNGQHVVPETLRREKAPLGYWESPHLTQAMKALAQTQGYTECAWTFPSALIFAQLQAGTDGEVHVFGFDATTDKMDAGGWAGGYHEPARWLREMPWIRLAWGTHCPCIQHGLAQSPQSPLQS